MNHQITEPTLNELKSLLDILEKQREELAEEISTYYRNEQESKWEKLLTEAYTPLLKRISRLEGQIRITERELEQQRIQEEKAAEPQVAVIPESPISESPVPDIPSPQQAPKSSPIPKRSHIPEETQKQIIQVALEIGKNPQKRLDSYLKFHRELENIYFQLVQLPEDSPDHKQLRLRRSALKHRLKSFTTMPIKS